MRVPGNGDIAANAPTSRRRDARSVALLLLVALAALLLVPAAASARKIAYPDLTILMPTNEISIVHKSAKKLLMFTHITSDQGEGPLEMRPAYNPETGISQGYQALYTENTPGSWQYAESVPIVGPMIWTPPSDYNFPLFKAWLLNTNAEGGPGSVIASSPKVLFCMTSDMQVGGAPNTPEENEYPSGACTEPEGRLGLTVGWGDEYDASDGGEGVEIPTLPNGTYWLRGEVDPYHYLQESNTANNITDTKIKIEGETVKVIEQVHTNSTPPAVTLESPAPETSLSGTVTLAASASGPAPITSVQFLLDGQPIGSPVTSPPYSIAWNAAAATPGRHFLSAQATDSRGYVGTALDTPVSVGTRAGSVTIDDVLHENGVSAVTSPEFSTSNAGELLLAFADSDGPSPGTQSMTVSGAGLTWSLVQRANLEAGDAEIWEAMAPGPLSKQTVQATATDGGYHATLTVAAISGAAGIGVSGAGGQLKSAPGIELSSSGIGSVGFATGNDWDNASARTLGSGQQMLYQDLETGTGDTFWTQVHDRRHRGRRRADHPQRHRSRQRPLEPGRGRGAPIIGNVRHRTPRNIDGEPHLRGDRLQQGLAQRQRHRQRRGRLGAVRARRQTDRQPGHEASLRVQVGQHGGEQRQPRADGPGHRHLGQHRRIGARGSERRKPRPRRVRASSSTCRAPSRAARPCRRLASPPPSPARSCSRSSRRVAPPPKNRSPKWRAAGSNGNSCAAPTPSLGTPRSGPGKPGR